jgi:hypothetical protein
MAQTYSLPFAFEFRKVAVEWAQVHAPILRWARRDDRTVDPAHVMLEIADKSGTREVTIPVRFVPFGDTKALLAASKSKFPDEALVELMSDTAVVAFTHSHRTYVHETDLIKHSAPANAAQMRTDFFRTNNEPAGALSFLNAWGRWVTLRNFVAMGELLELQTQVRKALVESPFDWLSSSYSDLPTVRSRSAEIPFFSVVTDACQLALRVTTTLDIIGEMKFGICARPDCQVPFPLTSQHSRSYCRQYCAHLESVRRNRERNAQRSI